MGSKNILIINLTRFGDLLQTQPVILGLQSQGHNVGLLCLDNFAPAAHMLNGLTHVTALPGSALLANMDTHWAHAFAHVDKLLQQLQANFPVHQVYNTTATLSARLLARRLSPPDADILGFGLDAHGFGISGDMWATFLQGASSQRLNCPYNIVDMFRAAAKVAHEQPLHDMRPPMQIPTQISDAVDALLMAQGPQIGYVAFQLGASEARRQWPVEYFATLGAQIWRQHGLCPVLLGSPAERPLAETYAHKARNVPFVDCVGATDIPHLAGVLTRTRLLVSNDTGTMHLAAGLKVPVLGIFLATAQPWDTAPYLENCCCVEPALECHPCAFHASCTHTHQCLKHISPQTLFYLASGFLQRGVWPCLASDLAQQTRAWRTCIDAKGFADMEDISGHEQDVRTVWLRMQRHYYSQILDEWQHQTNTSFTPPSTPANIPLMARQEMLVALRQTASLLHLMSEQGALMQHVHRAHTGQRLLATCRQVHRQLESCTPLAALGHVWLVITQERGDDLNKVLAMARTLREMLCAWQQWLEI